MGLIIGAYTVDNVWGLLLEPTELRMYGAYYWILFIKLEPTQLTMYEAYYWRLHS